MSQRVVAVNSAMGTPGVDGPVELGELVYSNQPNRLRCGVTVEGARFELTFERVMAMSVEPPEGAQDPSQFPARVSSFDEVERSAWVSSLGGKVTADYRHFVLRAREDVLAIVCRAMSCERVSESSHGGEA